MQAQPTDTSCGPACLQAIYAYWGDAITLDDVIEQTRALDEGGTLDVFLANHALERGYQATIHALNMALFDPTWFQGKEQAKIDQYLSQQAQSRPDDAKLQTATRGYQRFLQLGGRLRFGDISHTMVRRYLRRGRPVLTGLSATYLYRSARERPLDCQEDRIAGEPVGHFVVLSGFHRQHREILVADPYPDNPIDQSHLYCVDSDRLMGAIYLGIATWDANLLIIEPKPSTASREGE